MLHTKFQTSGPSGFEEEDFLIYFYGLNLGPMAWGHVGPWDLFFNKLGNGPPGNSKYQISSP